MEFENIANGVMNALKRKMGNLHPDIAKQAEERLAICSKCEHWAKTKCKLCGCKTQLYIVSEGKVCPDKPSRWGKMKPVQKNGNTKK